MNDLWIRGYHPAPAGAVPVVVLPYVGGSATAFRAFSGLLAPSVAPLIVQLPGRQDRHLEPCIDSIPEMADQIFAAVEPWTDGPLALFGHSMGAILGFEVARRLEGKLGAPPLRLFASGRRAPSCWRDDRVHTLPDAGVIAELASLNGTQPELLGDPDIVAMILPAVRGDYRAIENYRGARGDTITAPITVLTGTTDPQTTPAEAAAWESHTTGDFALTTFPGGHFFLNDHLPAIAEIVTRTLGLHVFKTHKPC